MTTFKRWRQTQNCERKHWEKMAEEIALTQDDLEWYQWKANQLKGRFLSKIPYISFEEENILEIGNGPVDMTVFLKGKKRYAMDTLENFF